MRTRRSANEEVAEVARRRLEQLSAELAAIRPDPPDPSNPSNPSDPSDPSNIGARDGSGEPLPHARDGWDGPPPDPRRRPDDPPPAGGRPAANTGRHAHRSVGPAAGLAGWVEDRLPATMQGRVGMSTGHLVVIAMVVLGGLVATLWWVSRADGGESAVPPLAVGASTSSAPEPAGGPSGRPSGTDAPSAGPEAAPSPLVTAAPSVTPGGASAGPGSSPPATGTIVVDVAGKVRRPGIATLPAGSRVVDALASAGGARRGARLGPLNLARVLTDGEQIVVGIPAPPGVAATAAAAPPSGAGTPLVNINSASQAELEELPDIGPVTAQSILDFRAENGTFTAVEELLEVSGIGDATLARVAPYVTL